MQDEVNEKTIALYIKTGKLTAQTLQKAMKAILSKGKTRLHFEDELKKPKSKGKLQFEADKTVRKVGDTLPSLSIVKL